MMLNENVFQNYDNDCKYQTLPWSLNLRNKILRVTFTTPSFTFIFKVKKVFPLGWGGGVVADTQIYILFLFKSLSYCCACEYFVSIQDMLSNR